MAVAQELGGRDFRIEFASRPIEIESGFIELDEYEKGFAAAIRDEMNPPLLTTVEITRAARARTPEEVAPPSANAFEQWLARRFYFLLPATFSVVSQIELEDGSTAAFFVRMPQEPLGQLEALIPKLLMWMAIIFVARAGHRADDDQSAAPARPRGHEHRQQSHRLESELGGDSRDRADRAASGHRQLQRNPGAHPPLHDRALEPAGGDLARPAHADHADAAARRDAAGAAARQVRPRPDGDGGAGRLVAGPVCGTRQVAPSASWSM